MRSKIDALELTHTWTLTHPPPDKKPIRCKWDYKTKYNPDSSIEQYKTQLVAKGYSQQEGLNYTETFAHAAKMVIVCTLLALVVAQG